MYVVDKYEGYGKVLYRFRLSFPIFIPATNAIQAAIRYIRDKTGNRDIIVTLQGKYRGITRDSPTVVKLPTGKASGDTTGLTHRVCRNLEFLFYGRKNNMEVDNIG